MRANRDRWAQDILLLLVIIGIGWWAHGQASQAEQALCAFRANVETRVAESEKYLADVAAGRREPVQGITDADIQRGLDNQRETLGALQGLNCPAPS